MKRKRTGDGPLTVAEERRLNELERQLGQQIAFAEETDAPRENYLRLAAALAGDKSIRSVSEFIDRLNRQTNHYGQNDQSAASEALKLWRRSEVAGEVAGRLAKTPQYCWTKKDSDGLWRQFKADFDGDRAAFDAAVRRAQDDFYEQRRLAVEREEARLAAAIDGAYRRWRRDNPGVSFNEFARRYEAAERQGAAALAALVAKPYNPAEGLSRSEPTQFANATVVPPDALFAAMPAFHGTPHQVDKFSTEKIGTGEGAQVYGWGLYFAENRDVGKNYQRNLAGGNDKFDGGRFVGSDPRHVAANLLDMAGGSRALAVSRLAGNEHPFYRNVAEIMRNKGEAKLEHGGNLYRVELNVEDDELLDWDSSLDWQPKKIRDLIAGKFNQPGGEHWVDTSRGGSGLYSSLMRHYQDNRRATSEYLASLGIKGIRYLDEQSRALEGDWILERNGKPVSDEGNVLRYLTREEAEADLQFYEGAQVAHSPQTHNYVIFNERDIKITHENDVPVDTRLNAAAPQLTADRQRLNAGARYVLTSRNGQTNFDLGLYHNDGELDFSDRGRTPGDLFRDNLGLAGFIAKGYANIPGAEAEDLRQRAKLALLKAARSYDAGRGLPFAVYAGRVIRNDLNALYTRSNRRRNLLNADSLDAPLTADSEGATRRDLLPAADGETALPLERGETATALREVLATLPPRLQAVMRDFMAGQTNEESARTLGISKQAVNAARKLAVNNLRTKLRARGFSGQEEGILYAGARALDTGEHDGSMSRVSDQRTGTGTNSDATLPAGDTSGAARRAANGRPSHLTDAEYARAVSPEFKAKYGDWEAAARQAALRKLVDRALDDKNWQTRTMIAEGADADPSGKLSQTFGFTVSKQYLTPDDIRKTDKRHGEGHEHDAEQAGLSRNDYVKALEVLRDPETFKKTTSRNGKPSAEFGRTFSDGTLVVAEVEVAEQGAVSVKSIWKKIPGRSHAGASSYPARTSENAAGIANTIHSDTLLVKPSDIKISLDENGEPKMSEATDNVLSPEENNKTIFAELVDGLPKEFKWADKEQYARLTTDEQARFWAVINQYFNPYGQKSGWLKDNGRDTKLTPFQWVSERMDNAAADADVDPNQSRPTEGTRLNAGERAADGHDDDADAELRELFDELMRDLPSQNEVNELRHAAKLEPEGKRTIGRPRKANYAADAGTRREIDVVQQMREDARERQRESEWNEAARRMLNKDEAAAKKMLLNKALNPRDYGTFTAVEVKAAQLLVPRLMREAYRGGNRQAQRRCC